MSFPVPAPMGAFASTNYEAYLTRFNDVREEPLFLRRRVTVGTTDLDLTVDPLPMALEAPALIDREFSIEGDPASTVAVTAFSIGGEAVWRVAGRVDGGRFAFELPSVPAGLADPFNGEVEVATTFVEYAPGVNLNATVVSDASAFLRGSSARFGDRVEFAAPDPNPFACPASVSGPVTEGGFAGGPIDGALVLFSYDRDAREGLPDVPFEVVAGAMSFSGRTDRNGCAQTVAAGLTGPVDIHLFPEDLQYQSALNVDASVATLRLGDPAQALSGTPDFAVVEGDIASGAFDDLGPAPAGEVPVIVVLAAPSVALTEPGQLGRDGFGLNTRAGILAPAEGLELLDYSVRVDAARTRDLIATGGFFDTTTELLQNTHIGLLPLPLPLQPRQLVTGLDLTELVPRDQVQTVTVTGPLAGEEVVVEASSVISTPNGGRFTVETSDEPPFTFDVPAQTGPLTGITYGATGRQTDEGLVNAFTFAREQGSATPDIALTLPPLPSNLTRNGRTWTVDVPAEVGDYASASAFVIQGGGFVNAWGAVIIDPPEQLSFTFPVPPGQDPLTGQIFLLLTASGLEAGVDAGAVSEFERAAAVLRSSGTSADTMP